MKQLLFVLTIAFTFISCSKTPTACIETKEDSPLKVQFTACSEKAAGHEWLIDDSTYVGDSVTVLMKRGSHQVKLTAFNKNAKKSHEITEAVVVENPLKGAYKLYTYVNGISQNNGEAFDVDFWDCAGEGPCTYQLTVGEKYIQELYDFNAGGDYLFLMNKNGDTTQIATITHLSVDSMTYVYKISSGSNGKATTKDGSDSEEGSTIEYTNRFIKQ